MTFFVYVFHALCISKQPGLIHLHIDPPLTRVSPLTKRHVVPKVTSHEYPQVDPVDASGILGDFVHVNGYLI